ncbi:unnamed protein product [Owenia fusiformis]|uniref:folate gamma-glutamyl hydrolase n=1 Tax=Owenia fusiformis TaxID=6347 RepID=A0A8S4PNR3_OWEFU|nr:unnamed protein product [Owenia fusiformis]
MNRLYSKSKIFKIDTFCIKCMVLWHIYCFGLSSSSPSLNFRPIIGVLAQSTGKSGAKYGETYIPYTYVNYLEMAGARVVPIKIDECEEYYEEIFKSINGVLFPGGGVDIVTSDFACEAKKLYDLAIKANDNGDYFPIWGTCLGFELLSALTAGKNILEHCSAENIRTSLDLVKGYEDSRLFHGIDGNILRILTETNSTANFHQYCLTPKNFNENSKLKQFYRVMSTDVDENGLEYISTMEAYQYPFYGVQWHPEKNIFVWTPTYNLDHSIDGVKIAQYMANFFVNEARKSQHTFPDVTKEQDALIYNYNPVYIKDNRFNINYYFKKGGTTPVCTVERSSNIFHSIVRFAFEPVSAFFGMDWFQKPALARFCNTTHFMRQLS